MKFFVRSIILAAVLGAVSWWLIVYSVNKAVEQVLIQDSIKKSEHWGTYMARRVPDIETLAKTGIPSPEQQQVIRQVRQVGEIFRFKLFNSDGRLSLISDDAAMINPIGVADMSDPEPLQVASNGIPIVEIYDGSEKPDRPDLYAEAYMPLFGPGGKVIGVIEVYVDLTDTRSFFVSSFKSYSLMIMGLLALVFAVPGLAFCLQRFFAKRARREVEFLANFDPLTGLLNRREFVAQAEALIAKENLSVVCYLDLDRFKSINDTYGHSAGDAFLAHVSGIIRKNCRLEDVLARFGGDEFVIGFNNTDLDVATLRIRKIICECAEEFKIDKTVLSGSVSVGIAQMHWNDTLEDALGNADVALYHAKSAGRNDFAIYGDEMGDELRRRHALETRLRAATREKDFKILYQPLVEGKNCELVGFEALLRLSDDEGSAIPPSIFIPLAEELGLIDEIGQWTIQTATREMAAYDRDKILAINLSTVQFVSGTLVTTVTDALEAADFPAHNLELEITESLLLDDSSFVAMQIDAFKEMGVAIAMDDFGTGFSSLSYLWKYGFDRLKIDRSFVAALEENPLRSREIIETVVMLGARLDMKITAEGVETPDQSELLSTLGCDVLQGYLFGKPSPLGSLESHGRQFLSGSEKDQPPKRA